MQFNKTEIQYFPNVETFNIELPNIRRIPSPK